MQERCKLDKSHARPNYLSSPDEDLNNNKIFGLGPTESQFVSELHEKDI